MRFADVRNLYSFHFHNDEDLSPFLEHLDPSAPLSLYFGLCDANVLHHFAVEPLVTSLMKTTGANDGEGAIVRIVREIQRATQAFHQFARAVGEAFFAKIGRANRALMSWSACWLRRSKRGASLTSEVRT